MQVKVLAAVVTYNRLNLLKRCINYLWQQSVLPDILIIDNQSTDGTKKYLTENNIDHVTQPNGGSSAGWFRGISEAGYRGYDHVWLMDDDGYPDAAALELLLANTDASVSCISSVIVKENKRDEFVFGIPVLNKQGYPVLFSTKRKYYKFSELPAGTVTYPFAHLFNGALVNMANVKRVGNVDRQFFLYGDEVDYFFRLKKVGIVCSLMTALHYHPDVSQRKIDKIRVYYFIRNTIILNKRYFDFVTHRNILAIVVSWVRLYKRNGIVTSLSYLFGVNGKYFYYGIIDGLKNNFIKRF